MGKNNLCLVVKFRPDIPEKVVLKVLLSVVDKVGHVVSVDFGDVHIRGKSCGAPVADEFICRRRQEYGVSDLPRGDRSLRQFSLDVNAS